MTYTWCIINLYMVQGIHAVYTFPKEIFSTYKQKKNKAQGKQYTYTGQKTTYQDALCSFSFYFLLCLV